MSIVLVPVCALSWCLLLHSTDSYYVIYLLTAAASLACCGCNRHRAASCLKSGSRGWICLFALGFSGMVYLANAALFDPASGSIRPCSPKMLLLALALLCTGFVVFREILLYLTAAAGSSHVRFHDSVSGARVGLIAWGCLFCVYCLVFYTCYYPGVLTYDSVNQLSQILGLQPYNNHHPFYDTQLVALILRLGLALFHDLNRAVGLYSQISILAMTGCFAYCIETLFASTGKKGLTVGLFLFYLLMPYHIFYSFAMWKDVFFAASVTGFTVSFFRTFYAIGSHPRQNRAAMLLFAGLMCLLRSNGLFAFAVCLVVFFFFFREKEKKLLWALCAVAAAAYLLTGPVLKMRNIPQPRITESLSIPLQQVAQVIVDECPLTDEQTALLEQCVDLDAVKEAFLPYISDPVKALVDSRPFAGQEGAYIKLYLQLGLRYPLKYIQAWVNQTRGYWNGGYAYWRFPAPYENGLGISISAPVESARALFSGYAQLFESSPLLQPLVSIGLFVWLMILCCFAALQRRDKVGVFLTVPYLAVILTLLIATPVFSEFRYSYCIFCGGPFVFAVTAHRLWSKA